MQIDQSILANLEIKKLNSYELFRYHHLTVHESRPKFNALQIIINEHESEGELSEVLQAVILYQQKILVADKLSQTLGFFQNAAIQLNKAWSEWDNVMTSDNLVKDYPFAVSFDDICSDIDKWESTMQLEISLITEKL